MKKGFKRLNTVNLFASLFNTKITSFYKNSLAFNRHNSLKQKSTIEGSSSPTNIAIDYSLFVFRRAIIMLFCFIIVTQASAQKQGQELVDSLENVLVNAPEDTNRVKVLCRLSFIYNRLNTKKGLLYAEQALSLSEKHNWKRGMAFSYNCLGTNYQIMSNYPKTLDNYLKALSICLEIGNERMISAAYNNIGLLYISHGNSTKGEEYLKKSIAINEKNNFKESLINNYTNLALIYHDQKKLEKAETLYQKALDIAKEINDKEAISRNLTNISLIKLEKKEFCQSLDLATLALKTSTEINNKYNRSFAYASIGRIYLQVAQNNEHMKEKCKYFKSSSKENYLISLKNLNLSMDLQKEVNELPDLETLNALSSAYESLSDYKNALSYYKKYSQTKDSIFSKDSSLKIADIEHQFELDLRENQIKLKNLQIENKTKQMQIQIVVSSIILVLIIFIIILINRKRQHQNAINALLSHKNEELLQVNATKDKLLSIISHDLRGPISSFTGLTQIIAEDMSGLTNENIHDIAVSMRKSATNLYSLLENLLQWSSLQRGFLTSDPEIQELLPIIDVSLTSVMDHASKKDIQVLCNINTDIKVLADTNLLQTVLRNLVSNAIKYTPRGGKISISAKENLTNHIEIAISDSGIGMSSSLIENLFRIDVKTNRKGTEGEPSAGLGLMLCKEFIEKLGGKLWIESIEGQGSTFYFTLPKH